MGNAMGVAALTGVGLTVAYQLLKSSEPPRRSEHTPYTPRHPGNSYRASSTSDTPRHPANSYRASSTSDTPRHPANSYRASSTAESSPRKVTNQYSVDHSTTTTRYTADDVTQYNARVGHSATSLTRNSASDVTQYKTGHSTHTASRNSVGEVTQNRAGNSTSPVTRSSAGDVTQYKTGRSTNSASTNSAGYVTKSAGNAVVGSMSIEKVNKRNEQNLKPPRRRESKNVHESLVLYHYTNEKCAEAIQKSRYIRESSDDSPYAHFGPGVYFTRLSPSCGKEQIARNNWTMGWESRVNSGRVDCAVRITFPKHKIKNRSTRKRDLFLHEGPVDLDEYDGLWDIVTVY